VIDEESKIKAMNDSVLSKLDENVKDSFLNPHFVETDKIKFPIKRKAESVITTAKKLKSDEPRVESKIKHKFQFF